MRSVENPIPTSSSDIEIGSIAEPRLTEEYIQAALRKGTEKFTKREQAYVFLNGIMFQAIILFLVLTDFGILLYGVANSEIE